MAAINIEGTVLTQEQQDVITLVIVGSYLNAKYPYLMSALEGSYSTGSWLRRKVLGMSKEIPKAWFYNEVIEFGQDIVEGLL